MAPLTKESFLKMFFTSVKLIRMRYDYNNESYKVTFSRENFFNVKMIPCEIIITPETTYYPNDKFPQFNSEEDRSLMVKNIIMESTTEIMYELNEKYSFDPKEYLLAMPNSTPAFKMKTDKMLYYNYFLMADPMIPKMRFMPTESERDVYNYILSSIQPDINTMMGKMNMSNMEPMFDKSYKIDENILNFYTEIYERRKKYNAYEGMMDMMSMQSTVTMWASADLTYEKVKNYIKSRHNIFGVTICQEMGWKIPYKFDADPYQMFNYTGVDYGKTPDMIIEEENTIVIVDFAVTNSDAGFVRDNKEKYYEDLREGLEKHTNKKTVVEAFVWNANTMDEYQIPDRYSEEISNLEENETIKGLYKLETLMKKQVNYNMFRKQVSTNEDDDYDKLSDKIGVYDNLISAISNSTSLSGKYADDIKNSRLDKKDRVTIKNKKRKFKEMDIKEDLENVSNEIDYNEYASKVSESIIKIIENNKIPKDLKDATEFNEESIRSAISQEYAKLKEQKKMYKEDINYKQKKVFKLPLASFDERNKKISTPAWFESDMDVELDDGTQLLKRKFQTQDDKENFKFGIGADEEDLELMENVLDVFKSNDTNYNAPISDLKKEFSDNEHLNSVMKTKIWNYLEFWTDMATNFAYLEGRRHLNNSTEGCTVFKSFGNYMMMLNSGSRLTSNKVVRFKIFTHRDNLTDFDKSEIFHSWKETIYDEEMMETTWLSMTLTDLGHFLKLKYTAVSLISDFNDKRLESNRIDQDSTSIIDNSLYGQMLLMMGHYRGASTSAQLNRYLVHSALGYITSREKLIKTINEHPVRTPIEAFIRMTQLKWYENMIPQIREFWSQRVQNMSSTDTSYDRLKMPSFFDASIQVEFSIMMNEMYVCNLIDKELGFMNHMEKAVVEKMTDMEMHYDEWKKHDWSRGNIDNLYNFFEEKDIFHTFDKKYVAAAMKYYNENNVNKVMMKEAQLKAMTAVIDDAMMMTASLMEGPYMDRDEDTNYKSEALKFNQNIIKEKSFITIFKEVERLSTNTLAYMVGVDDLVEVVMTVFPKAQVGGPREILIQSVNLRLFVKFFETISKEMCTLHEKEMLTKDHMKASIQSQKMAEFKNSLININKQEGKIAMFMSLNADCSKWSPSFVMENFMHLAYNWDIDESVKDLMMTVLSAFSSKKIMVSKNLREKWERKPRDEKEFSDAIQNYRERMYEEGSTTEICSGMGQGMLHFFSSFYHVILDDYAEFIMDKVMRKMYFTTVESSTLVSSDDKTKMLLFEFSDKSNLEKPIKTYMVALDLCNRLGNIHTNWKKSALNFWITEFNSLFSIGKRMCWATIKDIYTANSIPDLTSPEEAVIFMLSNIRRCMDHGVFKTTLEVMAKVCRLQLMNYYRFDKNLIKNIMIMLDLKDESMLPHTLGFLPTKKIFETLIYGAEIHMFDPMLSDTTKKFYKNLYSASMNDRKGIGKNMVPFSEASAGKYWFELPTRLDKRLTEIKDDFYNNNMNFTPEYINKNIERHSLNVNTSRNDMKQFFLFAMSYFVGMNRKYEFQDTMVVHSVIRALSLVKSKGIIYPTNTEYETIRQKFKEATKVKRMLNGKKITLVENIYQDTKMVLESKNVDILGFIEFILKDEGKNNNSSLKMLEGLRKIYQISEEVHAELNTMTKVQKFTHPNMKMLRFYTDSVGVSVSSKELLNFMFDPSSNMKNACVETFEAMKNMIGNEDMNEFENPFGFIRKFMNGCDYPMKAFKDFLTYYEKSLRRVRINMLSDTSCTGNMKSNLKNLYRTKSYPSYVLEDLSRKVHTQEQMDFLTEISLKEINTKDKIVNFSDRIINSETSRLDLAKMCYEASLGEWTNNKTLKYKRVEYRKKNINKNSVEISWANQEMIAKLVMNQNLREAKFYILASTIFEQLKNSDLMFTILRRQVTELNDMGYTLTFAYTGIEDSSFKLKYDICDIKWKAYVVYSTIKWDIKMSVHPAGQLYGSNFKTFTTNLFTDNYSLYSDSLKKITIMDDMMETMNLKEALEEPPDLKTLNLFFNKYNMLEQVPIASVDNRNSTDYQVSDITSYFSAASLQQARVTLGSMNMGNLTNEEEQAETMAEIPEAMKSADITAMFREALAQNKFIQMDQTEEQTEDVSNFEKQSVMKVMSQLVSKAMEQELDINKNFLKTQAKKAEKSEMDTITFQNLIFNQILWIMNNEISDAMALIIFSKIMKSNSRLSMMPITKHLNKLPRSRMKEVMDKRKPVEIFVTLKEDMDNNEESGTHAMGEAMGFHMFSPNR